MRVVCREYIGTIVRKVEAGQVTDQAFKRQDALQTGMTVATPSLHEPDGWVLSTVYQKEGRLYLKSGPNVGFLTFGEDDRNCWVCTGWANLPAIRKLELRS